MKIIKTKKYVNKIAEYEDYNEPYEDYNEPYEDYNESYWDEQEREEDEDSIYNDTAFLIDTFNKSGRDNIKLKEEGDGRFSLYIDKENYEFLAEGIISEIRDVLNELVSNKIGTNTNIQTDTPMGMNDDNPVEGVDY